MNISAYKRIFVRLSAMLVLGLLLCTVLGVGLLADSSYVICDFEADEVLWSLGENSHSIRYADLSFGDNKRSLLEITGNSVLPESMRTVTAHFDEPLDLSAYRTIKYDIFVPRYSYDSNASFYTRLTLRREGGESEKFLELVKCGQWNTVELDISLWDGRAAISDIEIALTVDTTNSVLGNYSFYIDELCADGTVDRELCGRFLFDVFTTKNGSATVSSDKTMIMMVPSQSTGMSLEATVSLPDGMRYSNCIRIRLVNRTDNDTLTLYYSTYDTEVTSEEKRVTIPIEPNSGENYYYANVGDVSMLQKMSFSFEKGGGRMELLSVSAVEAYIDESFDTCGKINAAVYDADSSKLTVRGEIDRAAALDNQSGLIALYSFDGNGLPTEDELSEQTPLATGIMSARFELEWDIPSTNSHAAKGRFIAVILCDGGGYKLIAQPFFADFDVSTPTLLWRDTKGFGASDISLVGDVGTGVTVLELDVLSALASKREAESFVYNGRTYYFDEAYLAELYSKITVLYNAGVSSLIRFSGWSRALAAELSAEYSADSYVSHAETANLSDGDDYIGAICAYIANEWCHDGRVAGIILGLCENLIPDGMRLSEAASDTAANLRAIYTNLSDFGVGVYLSVSDLYRFDPATGEGEIGLCEYIPMIVGKCTEYGDFPLGICVDILPRMVTVKGAEYIDGSDIQALSRDLHEAGLSDTSIIFCDSAHAAFGIGLTDAMSRYAIGYYTALFNEEIDAYIALAGDMEEYVIDTVRYIDTTEAKAIIGAVESLIGEELSERIDGWDKNRLPSKKITSAKMKSESGIEARGSFPYYKFSGISSIGGISPSYCATSLRVESDGASVLSVKLSPTRIGDSYTVWGGISHTFAVAENLRITPILALTVKLAGETDSDISVPIKLVLFSENERFEAVGELKVGEWTTLYIDTSEFSGAADTTALQLLVGCESGGRTLLLKSLDGLSREYNDESLSELIAESRAKKASPDAAVDYTRYLWIGGGVIILLATVLAVALLSRKRDGVE